MQQDTRKKMVRRFAVCVWGLAASAFGAAGTWSNPAGGAWDAGANWQGGVIPAGSSENDVAYLPALGSSVAIDHEGTSALNGFSLGANAAYTITGGRFHLHAAGSTDSKRGVYIPGGSGRLDLQSDIYAVGNVPFLVNDGAVLETTGRIWVNNSWLVKKGGGTWRIHGTLELSAANIGFTKGVVEVCAGGRIYAPDSSHWGPALTIGREGNSPTWVRILEGGVFEGAAHLVIVGDHGGAPTSFEVIGGVVTNTERIVVGGRGAGSLRVTEGGLVRIDTLNLCGTGGGQAAVTNGVLEVAREFCWKGYTGNEAYAGGSKATRLRLGPGGRAILPGTLPGGASTGTATLLFEGGTLAASGALSSAAVMDDYLAGLDEVQVDAAGGAIEYDGEAALGIMQDVSGAGSLVKNGRGAVRFRGDLSNLATLVLHAGTVAFGKGGPRLLRYGTGAAIDVGDLTGPRVEVGGFQPLTLDARLDFVAPQAAATAGEVVLATWAKGPAPGNVRLRVPDGLEARVVVDAARREIRAVVTAAPTDRPPPALATTRWLGAAGGDWTNPENWSAGAVPGMGDVAAFDLYPSANARVDLGATSVVLHRLFLNNPHALTFAGGPLQPIAGVTLRGGAATFPAGTLVAPEVDFADARLELDASSPVERITQDRGCLVLPNAGTMTGAYELGGPNSYAAGGIVEVNADVTWSGAFNATTPVVKRGAGTLTLTNVRNLTGDLKARDGGAGEYGKVPFGVDPVTGSPRVGYRGLTVLEGTVLFDCGENALYLDGAVLCGGWSTQAGSERAGHVEFRSGTFNLNEWLTVGRNNGNELTAPDGLESSFRMGPGATLQATGVWISPMLGDFSNSTSRARFIVDGGTMTVGGEYAMDTGILLGGGENPSDVAAPVLQINGGDVTQVGTRGLSLAYAKGWKGRVELNGGRLRVHSVKMAAGGAGEIVFNGGTLSVSNSVVLGSGRGDIQGDLTLRLAGGGAVVDVTDADHYFAIAQPFAVEQGAERAGLMKLGTGPSRMMTSQTYLGPTVIAAGSMRIYDGVTLAGPVVVSNGCWFGLSDGKVGSRSTIGGLHADGHLVLEATVAEDGSLLLDELVVNGDVTGAANIEINIDSALGVGVLYGRTFDVLRYTGRDPDVSGWTLRDAPDAVFTAADGRITVSTGVAPSGGAVRHWATEGDGEWNTAANWRENEVPGAAHGAQFDLSGPATVTTPEAGVAVGAIDLETGTLTLAGGAVSLGDGARVSVQGGRTLNFTAPVVVGATAQDTVRAVARNGTVNFAGELSGAGTWRMQGGMLGLGERTRAFAGTIDFDANSSVTLAPIGTGRWTCPIRATGCNWLTLAPENGCTATFAALDAERLWFERRAEVVLEAASLGRDIRLYAGRLSTPAVPDDAVVMGVAALRYTGAGEAAFNRLMIGSSWGCPTIDVARQGATLTVAGPVTLSGTDSYFIKRGPGTLRLTGAGTLANGPGAADYMTTMDNPDFGRAPTCGTRSVNVVDGALVFDGDATSEWDWYNTLAIGMASTKEAGAETTGRVEVRGGRLFGQEVALSRGNGTRVTAPTPLVAELIVNGGTLEQTGSGGLFACTTLNDQTDSNGQARFVVNAGRAIFNGAFQGGNATSAVVRVECRGGTTTFAKGAELTKRGGARTTFTVSGDAEVAIGTKEGVVNFSSAASGAKTATAEIRLDGGTLRARGFTCGAGGAGTFTFAGGTLEPLASGTLIPENTRITWEVAAGGGAIRVPAGEVAAIAAPLTGSGELTLAGEGAVVLSNTVHVAGALNIAGTLAVAAPATQAPVVAGAVTFAPGARVRVIGSRLALTAGGSLPILAASSFAGVENLTLAAESVLRGSLVVREGTLYLDNAQAVGRHEWTARAGGAWSGGDNWDVPPGAGAAEAAVRFGKAAQAPAAVAVDTAATLGTVEFENAVPYTLGGALPLTLAGDAPTLRVAEGAHTITAPLVLPDGHARVELASKSALTISGGLAGAGTLTRSASAGSELALRGTSTFTGELNLYSSNSVAGGAPLGTGTATLFGGSTLVVPQGEQADLPGALRFANGEGVTVLSTPAAGTTLRSLGTTSLSGTTGGNNKMLLKKTGLGEWRVLGELTEAGSHHMKLMMYGGTVRFTGGVRARFGTSRDRASVDFNFNNLKDMPIAEFRAFVVDGGAHVETGGIFLGGSKTQALEVGTGGSLDLQGWSGDLNALVVGNVGSTATRVDVHSSGGLFATNVAKWVSLGAYEDKKVAFRVDGGLARISNLSLGMDVMDTGRNGAAATVSVSNGVLEVFNRMNWMGENTASRVNRVIVRREGELRLCDTFRSSTGGGTAILTLDGGTVRHLPGGADSAHGRDWLTGLTSIALERDSVLEVGAGDAAETAAAIVGTGAARLFKRGDGTLTMKRVPELPQGEMWADEGVLAFDLAEPGVARVRTGYLGTLSNATDQTTFALLGGEGRIVGSATVTGTLDPGRVAGEDAGASLRLAELTFAADATNRCDLVFGADGQADVNDVFAVDGKLAIVGAGVVDLGLAEGELPPSPANKRVVLGSFGSLEGVENLANWRVVNAGGPVGDVKLEAEEGLLVLSFRVRSGFAIILR